jgi:hypothetical protein
VPDHARELNYPDILGLLSGGPFLNLDMIQCAMTVRPAQTPAGRLCDIVVVMQNAADIDVDVTVTLDLPDRDLAGGKGRFSARTSRLLVGLRPAEVGVMTLPILVSPTAQPGPGYVARLHLDIKRIGKKPQRVRTLAGGGEFDLSTLSKEAQQQLAALRGLPYSSESGGKKHQLQAAFEVLPPALASLTALKEQKANWVSLWTMQDYLDDRVILEKTWSIAQTATIHLKRDIVFMPLLRATQDRFKACQYPLLPPEAICVTKLLTHVLETEVPMPGPQTPLSTLPRWFMRMARLLFQEPALASQHEALATRLVYDELLHDAIIQGFSMVSMVSGEQFGSSEETERYAEALVETLREQQPVDLARVYLPLVMAGLIGVGRVTMPREQVRDTVFMLSKALERRRAEKTPENAFIFDITGQLVDRALDTL